MRAHREVSRPLLVRRVHPRPVQVQAAVGAPREKHGLLAAPLVLLHRASTAATTQIVTMQLEETRACCFPSRLRLTHRCLSLGGCSLLPLATWLTPPMSSPSSRQLQLDLLLQALLMCLPFPIPLPLTGLLGEEAGVEVAEVEAQLVQLVYHHHLQRLGRLPVHGPRWRLSILTASPSQMPPPPQTRRRFPGPQPGLRRHRRLLLGLLLRRCLCLLRRRQSESLARV